MGLSRSGYYYRPKGESDYNVSLMRQIDEEYTRHPFYGMRRMTAWLRLQGHVVNRKRVRRLMQCMALEAIYPKPRLSQGTEQHRKYPYLLGGLEIEHPNQVWCTDITYIRLHKGFAYLVAIMDWHSRYVLSWELSNALEADFCVDALDVALGVARPEIFNSDQGSQFTSDTFTDRLLAAGVRISMDARGRVFDNIFIERLWRTVKYEEVYLHDYTSMADSRARLAEYFAFYNRERLHQALGDRTPHAVYWRN